VTASSLEACVVLPGKLQCSAQTLTVSANDDTVRVINKVPNKQIPKHPELSLALFEFVQTLLFLNLYNGSRLGLMNV